MKATDWAARAGAGVIGRLGPLALVASLLAGPGSAMAEPGAGSKADPAPLGREIFNREWLPGDPRSHGGDGLGPVYNDTSCVACHNAGGPGGAGPLSKNIDILSATRTDNQVQQLVVAAGPRIPANVEPLAEFHAGFRAARTVVLHRYGTDPNYEPWRLAALGLGTSPGQMQQSPVNNFVVFTGRLGLPRGNAVDPNGAMLPKNHSSPAPPDRAPAGAFASDLPFSGPALAIDEDESAVRDDLPQAQNFAQVRQGRPARSQSLTTATADARSMVAMQQAALAMQGPNAGRAQLPIGEFTVTRSQRNPTPLFGIGLIDSVPDAALEAAAARRDPRFPEVQGRVSRLKDGRIGRLGWKGQTASSEDFVLTACAVELGLEVPGHEQAVVPQAPRYKAGGLDLTAQECDALTAYVRALPRPDERAPSSPAESVALAAGRASFAAVGCASCHTPTLGEVQGIYSDLLLHDMGPQLADLGSYNGSTGDEADDVESPGPLASGGPTAPRRGGASRQEWRTPPLWGFRDSGPYLHDGRAQTLDQAVALHDGQGAPSAQRFFKLSPRERLQVETFLKSLTAPAQLARAGD